MALRKMWLKENEGKYTQEVATSIRKGGGKAEKNTGCEKEDQG